MISQLVIKTVHQFCINLNMQQTLHSQSPFILLTILQSGVLLLILHSLTFSRAGITVRSIKETLILQKLAFVLKSARSLLLFLFNSMTVHLKKRSPLLGYLPKTSPTWWSILETTKAENAPLPRRLQHTPAAQPTAHERTLIQCKYRAAAQWE